ncbi:hypothetical protein GLOIN_2v1765680 [Rhizophagus irregularis DAOM 181602=DAOM 197198]|nr:hypothetical protein GLOIN_2v1765680 [Rhizophagus irregularis DAOM 181602=DAOM 197198]
MVDHKDIETAQVKVIKTALRKGKKYDNIAKNYGGYLKKLRAEKEPNEYIKTLAVKMFPNEEAYTIRLENYRKRYLDNDLCASLVYALYYQIAKEENRERSDEENFFLGLRSSDHQPVVFLPDDEMATMNLSKNVDQGMNGITKRILDLYQNGMTGRNFLRHQNLLEDKGNQALEKRKLLRNLYIVYPVLVELPYCAEELRLEIWPDGINIDDRRKIKVGDNADDLDKFRCGLLLQDKDSIVDYYSNVKRCNDSSISVKNISEENSLEDYHKKIDRIKLFRSRARCAMLKLYIATAEIGYLYDSDCFNFESMIDLSLDLD